MNGNAHLLAKLYFDLEDDFISTEVFSYWIFEIDCGSYLFRLVQLYFLFYPKKKRKFALRMDDNDLVVVPINQKNCCVSIAVRVHRGIKFFYLF